MCDGDAGGGFEFLPPDPNLQPADTPTNDLTTWMRSLPLVMGMMIVAGVVFLCALIFFAALSPPNAGQQPVWAALAFAATSLVISWMWLRPWLFGERRAPHVDSDKVTEPGEQGE